MTATALLVAFLCGVAGIALGFGAAFLLIAAWPRRRHVQQPATRFPQLHQGLDRYDHWEPYNPDPGENVRTMLNDYEHARLWWQRFTSGRDSEGLH